MTRSPTATTSLAVLCGGRSRRLGTDKGLYEPLGDEPLFARAVRLLGDDFGEILIVTRDEAQAQVYEDAVARHLSEPERAKVRVVADASTGYCVLPEAAIAGVHTAVATAAFERVVVLPVDQVGVRPLHLRRLVREAADQAAAFEDDEGGILPFPSLWPKASRERLAALMEAGAFSVRGALAEAACAKVQADDWRAELAFNGNTAAELEAYFGQPLFDPFGRRLHYLRFSMTEACNLACTYCLPDGFPEWYRHKARLGTAEIDVLLAGFRRLGFRKVRLTGGEPTVHPGCLETVRRARQLGFERIAMTTNGLKLAETPDLTPWVDAGLTHLNVSLDALDEQRFHAVTGSRAVKAVVRVIEEGVARGLSVKVNTVLLRSRNGDRDNIESLIDWATELPLTLRFIELMETKLNGTFAGSERVLGTEIEPLLEARGLTRLGDHQKAPDLRGPATDYARPDKPGRIGLINPMSCNFCSKCNRLRITAKGRLKLCLFGDQDLPLDLSSAAAVALNVRQLIGRKPERHYLEDGNVGNVATFRTIGG